MCSACAQFSGWWWSDRVDNVINPRASVGLGAQDHQVVNFFHLVVMFSIWKTSENIHKILLSWYFREKLQQRVLGRLFPGKAPLDTAQFPVCRALSTFLWCGYSQTFLKHLLWNCFLNTGPYTVKIQLAFVGWVHYKYAQESRSCHFIILLIGVNRAFPTFCYLSYA